MKNLILKLSFIISFFLCFNCTINGNETIIDEKEEIKIHVYFHCGHGKAKLENQLPQVEGIDEVYADLKTKIVTINFDNSIITKDEIVESIEKIGFYTEFSDKTKKLDSGCSHGGKEHDKSDAPSQDDDNNHDHKHEH